MRDEQFIDYYELLQVSPNANAGTIDRVFRYLAKQYHPDNQQTGDRERFELLLKAYRTLTDPEERARYDVQYQKARKLELELAREARNAGGLEGDRVIRWRILSVLYVQRRREMDNPGVGSFVLEKLLDCPHEYLEFHLWYMKQKGWIERTDGGLLAITADGVDQLDANYAPVGRERLLTAEANQPKSGPENPDLPPLSS
jgi:curved DNA-binding protein CbpA